MQSASCIIPRTKNKPAKKLNNNFLVALCCFICSEKVIERNYSWYPSDSTVDSRALALCVADWNLIPGTSHNPLSLQLSSLHSLHLNFEHRTQSKPLAISGVSPKQTKTEVTKIAQKIKSSHQIKYFSFTCYCLPIQKRM